MVSEPGKKATEQENEGLNRQIDQYNSLADAINKNAAHICEWHFVKSLVQGLLGHKDFQRSGLCVFHGLDKAVHFGSQGF